MHRLFVAIEPPPHIRQLLLDIMGGVAYARWQDDSQLHLTLRFIGEVGRHRAEEIAAALHAVHREPFEITLSGVGSFGKRGKGALWAGVAPQGELKALHKKVNQACLRAGVEPDIRAYHPHITIARLGRGAGPVDSFMQRWAALASEPFEVNSFSLYESRLGSEGATYTVAAHYSLA